MTFIGILLALVAERVLGHLPRVGEPIHIIDGPLQLPIGSRAPRS